MVDSGAIADATHIWWAIGPSQRYPTLELRIADTCTLVEDVVCIAAIFRCLVQALWRDPSRNAEIAPLTRLVIDENRWRARRYGVAASLIDVAAARLQPFADAVEDCLALVADDAAWFGCTAEVAHARTIVARGSSADMQLRCYAAAARDATSRTDALRAVCRWISEATLAGAGTAGHAAGVQAG
jgi:carboxylate-amine ligase